MTGLEQGREETTSQDVSLRVDGLAVAAHHARPDGMPKAGLVLAPDIGGIRPLFEEMAARIASHGLAVMVVEPFPRVPAEQRAGLAVEDRLARVKDLDDGEQLGALEAAADHLVVHDDVRQVSVLGFCMGGYYTLKAAATERFDRAVAFYGMIRTPEMWEGPGHRSPLDTAAVVCPTLAVFGGADQWSPAADIDALRQAWSSRDDCEIVVVEGAEHGFVHDPDRPAYRPDDAAPLWAQALAWVTP
ncbi:MAG: dienelactone hydrolase family protein [Acidimicrobiia bacterium]|nr:dienelactone hydrolase family protein [Acidimicrobiia bacterium]